MYKEFGLRRTLFFLLKNDQKRFDALASMVLS